MAAGAALPVGLSVLLVEDDADVRAVVQAFLDSLGCRTSAFASGEQALLALGDGADFELLLSDIALGAGMRGIELAAAAQLQLPQLAVLLMSGYSAELLQADREAPASWELLRKPFTRDQLAAAIAKLMAAREDRGLNDARTTAAPPRPGPGCAARTRSVPRPAGCGCRAGPSRGSGSGPDAPGATARG